MNHIIKTGLVAAMLTLPIPAFAGIVFDSSAKPTPAADIDATFSNKSWMWDFCKGCGAYFGADHTFLEIWKEPKPGYIIGRGTWAAKDGQICWTPAIKAKGASEAATEHCWSAMTGKAKEGSKTVEDVFGIRNPKEKDYTWLMKGKQAWKDFVDGDKVTPLVAKIEPTLQ